MTLRYLTTDKNIVKGCLFIYVASCNVNILLTLFSQCLENIKFIVFIYIDVNNQCLILRPINFKSN